jgi:hypothetical protein
MTDEDIWALLAPIRRIREANNDPWMTLVFLAAKHAPLEAADALDLIGGNDTGVTRWTHRLSAELRKG